VSGRFAFLSRFGVKFVEVAGAGFASAACAYFLGLIGQQPPAPPPAIVQVVPSEDAMRMARDDHALLAALVRKETEGRKDAEGRKDSESQAKLEAAAAPKPVKPPQAAQVRRSQKPEQAAASEPLAIQPPLAAANAAPKPAIQSPMPLLGVTDLRPPHRVPARTSGLCSPA
jgi:hypothetical protein